MYATEFQTVINEPYIHIPNYERFKGHKVRIVVLNIDNEYNNIVPNKKEDFIEYLINNPIKVSKDFKFLTREEANER
jgi:hypothetical protein